MPRTAYYTGEVVEGAVVLRTDREMRARGLHVDFIGREETRIARGSGDDRRTFRSAKEHVAWRLPLMGEAAIPSGVHRFPFRLQIPFEALPSYRGTHADVAYTLTARIDVPLWPDASWTGEVFVFYDRNSIRQFAQPVRFRSGGSGPEVYVELDGDRFFARELIGCRITLLHVGAARVRRVYGRLIGGEWARADGQEESTIAYRHEWSVPAESVRVGVPFEFEIPIPAEAPSSYLGEHSYFSYFFEVALDIAWGYDIVARTPIVIVR